jgi:hypothetical protein
MAVLVSTPNPEPRGIASGDAYSCRLGWFCFDGFLSLGFGRPQSTQFETVDEQGFLQLRLNQPLPRPGSTQSTSLYGDVYIAGQVQLTQIGRDLINWGEMLSDPERAMLADPRRASMMRDRELSVTTMFRELNARLDEWSRLWVWAGESSASSSWDICLAALTLMLIHWYRLAVHLVPRLLSQDCPATSGAYAPVPELLRAQISAGRGRDDCAMPQEGAQFGHVNDPDAL